MGYYLREIFGGILDTHLMFPVPEFPKDFPTKVPEAHRKWPNLIFHHKFVAVKF